MSDHFQAFLNAVMFFTRIPVKARYSPELLDRASAWFPLVGWIVGGFGAGFFLLGMLFWSPVLAVLLSMGATIFLTGAFHEDGLADVCDGFGGAFERGRVLEIMKDSRIGTYGTAGLVLMLGAKAAALMALDVRVVPLALLAGHAVSRFASTSLIFWGSYAREDATSKSKPLATHLSRGGLGLAALFGIAPLLFLDGLRPWIGLCCTLLCARLLLRWFNRRIGGYTGDCLGATQQICELVFYLVLVAQPATFA